MYLLEFFSKEIPKCICGEDVPASCSSGNLSPRQYVDTATIFILFILSYRFCKCSSIHQSHIRVENKNISILAYKHHKIYIHSIYLYIIESFRGWIAGTFNFIIQLLHLQTHLLCNFNDKARLPQLYSIAELWLNHISWINDILNGQPYYQCLYVILREYKEEY